MVKELKIIFKTYCKSFPVFMRNDLILLLSIATGVASAALGYGSYSWHGMFSAIFAAFSNFIFQTGINVVFLSLLFEKISKLFDADYRFHIMLVSLLKAIKKDYLHCFDNEKFSINEKNVQNFLDDILFFAEQREKENIFIFNTIHSNPLKKYCLKGLDFSLGFLTGSSFFTFMTLSAQRSMEIICEFANCDLQSISENYQILISGIAGIASGILGFILGLELREVAHAVYQHLKNEPKDLLKLIGIIIVCLGVSTTVFNQVFELINNKNNFLSKLDDLGIIVIFGSTLTNFSLNCKPFINLLMQKNNYPLTLNNVNEWFKTNHLPSESITYLQNHSFFKNTRVTELNNHHKLSSVKFIE